jgi:hypothetical protein
MNNGLCEFDEKEIMWVNIRGVDCEQISFKKNSGKFLGWGIMPYGIRKDSPSCITAGIIETENGTIKLISAESIRFIDKTAPEKSDAQINTGVRAV